MNLSCSTSLSVTTFPTKHGSKCTTLASRTPHSNAFRSQFLPIGNENAAHTAFPVRHHCVRGRHKGAAAAGRFLSSASRMTDCEMRGLNPTREAFQLERARSFLQKSSSLESSYQRRGTWFQKGSRCASNNVDGASEGPSPAEEAASISPAFPREFESRKSADVVSLARLVVW